MKIAVVTGASSGLGREFARQISTKYSKLDEIWLIARRREPMEEIAAQMKVTARIVSMDLMDDNEFAEFEKLLQTEMPDIKLLVNCAGFGKTGRVDDIGMDDQLGMIDLNCKSLTRITVMCLPYITSHSRIINIASSAAFLPQPNFAVYAATKSYVLSFSKALGVELKKRKISVTSVCPGPVDTEFFDIAGKDVKFLKRLVMAKPELVVEKAIRDAALGVDVSVYGKTMNILWRLSKFVPQKLSMKLFA